MKGSLCILLFYFSEIFIYISIYSHKALHLPRHQQSCKQCL